MLKPRRQLLQYSLGALLIVVTGIGIALGPVVNHAHHQKQTVEAVTRIGGKVFFTDNSHGPIWLRQLIGDDYFRTIKGINLQHCPGTDDLLADISALSRLDELNLTQCDLTDKSLKQIAKLENLKALRLGFNPITDEGLKHLVRLDQLLVLDLCVTKITDDGLNSLLKFHKLDRLELFATRITDAGAATVARMSSLTELDVADTFITNDGVAHLVNLPNLAWLRLDQAAAGFGRELRINDAGLEYVARMPKLREVRLMQLGVTNNGLQSLKDRRPALIVIR
jgi:Ran GTPase-activating protein (RanGAP) involved in mRNA processing and transport